MKIIRHNRHALGSNRTSTILSITLVLLIFGILLLMGYHTQRQSFRAQEQLTYKVDLIPDVSDVRARALADSIAQLSHVRKVDYISKEEAAAIFSNEIGEDFVEFIGYNPLSPTIMVNFWAEWDPEEAARITDQFSQSIKKLDIVTGVAYQEHVVDEIISMFRKVTIFLIAFGLLLFIICYIMIRNTIRMDIYTQRTTIQTMRMVGATKSFIMRPFVLRSIAYGAIGGFLAVILLFIIFYIFNHEFGFALLHPHHFSRYAFIALVIVAIGVAISWLSTEVVMRRSIRKYTN